jgi:two-component system phosphate regulon sensor histidine kinase PhoR
MSKAWQAELTAFLALSAGAALLGRLLGHPFALLALAWLGFLAWHWYRLYDLDRSLARPEAAEFGAPPGMWGQLHHRLRVLARAQRAEHDQLRAVMERHHEIIRALPDATVSVGERNEIETTNRAAQDLLGLSVPRDAGQPITNLLRDPLLVQYLARGEFGEALETNAPGRPDVRLSLRVIRFGDTGKKLLLLRDVTRLAKLERMRRDFIANVSHELKSPLTVVRGHIESLAADQSEFARKWEKPIARIEEQAQRMCHIVDDLLQLSRLETEQAASRREPVDVPALIRALCRELDATCRDTHTLETELDETLQVAGDANEIHSAFSNLVANACQYTPARGKVTIRWFESLGEARFAVADTGVGIAREHIPRLTERFYRVDQARSRSLGGTGLGLAIVKHILQRHGASLQIESEMGRGSTFTCVFPPERLIRREQRAIGAN